MKARVVGFVMGLIFCLNMLGWLGLSYAQPPKKRLSLGVRYFCITHPDRPACQQWEKAV